MIIKFDEPALKAAFGQTFVEGMRHMIRQLGAIEHQTTLPEVAALTDTLAPIVAGLTITLTATNATVADLAANASEHGYSDSHLIRRIDELASALETATIDRSGLIRTIEEAVRLAEQQTFNLAELTRRITQLEDA